MRTVKAFKKYIVAQARSITDVQNVMLVYKRKSFGGNEHLYAGIPNDRFGGFDIDGVEMSLYEYNDLYKVYVQPTNSRQAYVFTLDDLKLQVKDTDLSQFDSAQIFTTNSSFFSLANVFFIGRDSSGGSQSGSFTTDTSGSGLLIGLIIFVVVLLVGIAAGVAVVLFKQNAKKNQSTYLDQTDLNRSTNNNRSEDNLNRTNEMTKF